MNIDQLLQTFLWEETNCIYVAQTMEGSIKALKSLRDRLEAVGYETTTHGRRLYMNHTAAYVAFLSADSTPCGASLEHVPVMVHEPLNLDPTSATFIDLHMIPAPEKGKDVMVIGIHERTYP